MASSIFWRDLTSRFLVLKAAMQADSWLIIKALWTSDQSVTPPLEHWQIQANDQGFRISFEAVARTGGDALSPNEFVDPLYVWIAALAREWRATGVSPHPVGDGMELDNLVEASITLCASMETEMLGAERHQRYLDALSAGQRVSPPVAPVASLPPAQPPIEQPPPNQLSQRPATMGFPNRAAWLRARLDDRGWDHNTLEQHNGPDRKTNLKILSGGKVTNKILNKIIAGLNSHTKAAKTKYIDIPKG